MLKSLSINNFLILCFLILGVLAYEIHLYDFYFLISGLSFAFLIIFFVVKDKKIINFSLFWFIILLFYYLSYFVSILLNNDLMGAFRVVISILVVLICFCIFDYTSLILKNLLFILLPILLITYLIQFTNLVFPFWDFTFYRNSSIFFDPNFASVFLGLGALIALTINNKNKISIILFLLFSIGTFLTFSKAAIIALILSVSTFFLRRLSPLYSISILTFLSFILYFLFLVLDLTMFRVEQGLNERDNLWRFVFDYVFNNQNLFGIGYSNIKDVLAFNGFKNSSTHNYYFDILLTYGLLAFIFNIIFSLSVILVMFIKNSIYLPLFIFLFIQSNAILISFGGIGLLSVIITLLAVTQIPSLSEKK